MSFVYPTFLFALALLGIPIIIHLFNFRRFKTVYFSQVKFLKEVKQQTKSISRLKHIIVLISRILAIACLIIAFAQPYIAENDLVDHAKNRGVIFYIDNSFSMEAVYENSSLLDLAKQKALDVVNAYEESDKFILISNHFSTKQLRWKSKEDIKNEILQLDASPRIKNFTSIAERFEAIDGEEFDQIDHYILSDLQRSTFNINELNKREPPFNIILLPSETVQNLVVNNVNFEAPYHLFTNNEQLNFTIKNIGENKKDEVQLKLFLNNKLKSPLTLSLENKDSVESNINFQPTATKTTEAELTISDYPIKFDDTLFFNYKVTEQINVLHLYDANPNNYIQQLYSNDSIFNYHQQSTKLLNYSDFNLNSLIILESSTNLSSGFKGALKQFLSGGGTLLLQIDATTSQKDYNQFLNTLGLEQLLDFQEQQFEVKNIETEDELFEEVFEEKPNQIKLPYSKGAWLFSNAIRNNRSDMLSYSSTLPFLRKYELEKGRLYLLNSALSEEKSNFGRHAIFVPIFYNIGLYSQAKTPLYYHLSDEQISLDIDFTDEAPISIKGKGIEFIPKQLRRGGKTVLDLNDRIDKAGHYKVFQGDEEKMTLSLNYSRKESDFTSLSIDELKELIQKNELNWSIFQANDKGLTNEIQYAQKGKAMWKYFIILALLFFGIETLLLRIL